MWLIYSKLISTTTSASMYLKYHSPQITNLTNSYCTEKQRCWGDGAERTGERLCQLRQRNICFDINMQCFVPLPPHVVWYNLQVHNICEETCLICVETISHKYYNLHLLLTKTVVSGHELTGPASIFIISSRQATFFINEGALSWICIYHPIMALFHACLVLQSGGFFPHWLYISYYLQARGAQRMVW